MNNNTFIKSIIFSFVFSGVLFFSVLLPCFPVHAEGTVLPYIVPEYRDLNNFVPDAVIEQAIEYYFTYKPSNVTVNSFMIYAGPYTNTNDTGYRIYFITNPSVPSGISPSYDFTSNTLRVISNNFPICDVIIGDDLGFWGFETDLGNDIYLLGTINSVTQFNGKLITDNYIYYYFGPDIYSSRIDGGDPVLIFTNTMPYTPDVFDTGHAVEPDFDSDTVIDSSLHPNIKPTFPTFNTYNITNYTSPTIDTSSTDALLESLIDVVIYNASYLVSNIVGAIQNLWDNLSDLLEYLGDLLGYLFNKVINTIKQVADNLYQNFKDLFEPVLNSFENFINIINTFYVLGLEDDTFNFGTLFTNLFVPSQSDLEGILVGTHEYDFLTDVSSFIIDWLYFVDDIINDDSIYEIHIPSFEFAGTTIPAMTVSFDWYIPIKPTIDAIISAFLIFGYGWWLFTRLAGLFHGQAPDSKVVSSLKE